MGQACVGLWELFAESQVARLQQHNFLARLTALYSRDDLKKWRLLEKWEIAIPMSRI